MKIQKQTAKNYSLFLMVILVIVSFVMIVTAVALSLGRHKIDLTSQHRAAINPQTQKIVENLQSPVNVTVYMSDNLGSEYPELGLQSQFLLRLLERYRDLSNGKLSINIKKTEPFSLAEEEAKQAGIRAFPDSSGIDNLYFGAVFNNEKGENYTIPYFSVQRQNYTEYDISRILAKLSKFDKKIVAIAAFGANPNDWQFTKQLKNDYQVELINKETAVIPSAVKVLLVYNPQQVPTTFIYALDQYILRGGKVILLLDPYSEATVKKYPFTASYKNNLLPLLKNIGLEFNPDLVAGDKKLSTKERRNNQQDGDYAVWFDLPKKAVANQNVLTAGFLNFAFRTPGELVAHPKDTADYQLLFGTSDEGGTISADYVKYGSREIVNHNFQTDNKSHALAYWINGWFESLYEESIVAGTEMEAKLPPFIIASIEKASILVIADSDFLTDNSWNLAKYQDKSTVYDQVPGANNADFLLRAVDFMTGNISLVGLYPNYMINSDKSIGEQIYGNVFQTYAPAYKEKENQIAQLQNEFNEFKNSLHNNTVGMSLSKIQNLENYQRRIQQLQDELKFLEFQVKTANEQDVVKIILANTLFFPMILIFALWLGVKIYNRRQKQKILRLINE